MGGWAHIILVGASIVSNAFRDGAIVEDARRLEERLNIEPNLYDYLAERLYSYLEQDCKKASAELNTCLDLIVEGYTSGRQQWSHLLASETNIGRLCSQVLARYLRVFSSSKLDGKLSVLEPRFIKYLGDPGRFTDGLANLFDEIVKLITYHKSKGDVVFVHATGGYKPEIAIAILAANSPGAGAPTFYIHEHFNQLIKIPALPITFRRLRKFSDMMNSLAGVEKVNKEQYSSIFGRRAIEEAIRLGWIIEEDGSLKLTLFGRLLWKKIRR